MYLRSAWYFAVFVTWLSSVLLWQAKRIPQTKEERGACRVLLHGTRNTSRVCPVVLARTHIDRHFSCKTFRRKLQTMTNRGRVGKGENRRWAKEDPHIRRNGRLCLGWWGGVCKGDKIRFYPGISVINNGKTWISRFKGKRTITK